jgi:alpha-N-arabinofuranosidase
MPTFGTWEATVLDLAYDEVDYISCHAYYEERGGDLGSFLASAVDMDQFIDSVVATADAVGARRRSRKRINVSFDEWNVWYHRRFLETGPPMEWVHAPRLIEDAYNVADAVVVGSLLISLLRHNDRLAAACLAQLVNVIAPIRTEPHGPSWRQTTFYPFAQASRFAQGEVLRASLAAPTYETASFGAVPVVEAVATHDPDAGELVVFAVNRHPSTAVRLSVDLRAWPPMRLVSASVLADRDVRATNTADQPDRVRPRQADKAAVDGAILHAALPPVSWNVLALVPASAPPTPQERSR